MAADLDLFFHLTVRGYGFYDTGQVERFTVVIDTSGGKEFLDPALGSDNKFATAFRNEWVQFLKPIELSRVTMAEWLSITPVSRYDSIFP